MKDLEIDGTSIVILGGFNPPIFSPAWLRLHRLIGEEEADKAEIQVITPPIAVFSTDWVHVDVRRDRLTISTAMSQDVDRLRDLAVSVLQILPEVPVAALGINKDVHWRAASEASFHQFGDTLAPKQFWKRNMVLPGTAGMQIQGIRPDEWAGWINVIVQRSSMVSPCGIYAQVNDHFWLKKVERQPVTRDEFSELSENNLVPAAHRDLIPLALEILRDRWNSRLERSAAVIADLVVLSREGA